MKRAVSKGIAGLGVLFASQAYGIFATAELNVKVFPGSLCRQVLDTSAAVPNALDFDGAGRIANTSLARAKVVCPVMRDGFGSSYVSVRVVDQSDSQNVECHLKTPTFTGAVVATADSRDWPPFTLSLGKAPSDAAHREEHIVCYLPPPGPDAPIGDGRSRIVAFTVAEGDGADDGSSDWKSYPGTFCTQTGGAATARHSDTGSILNPATFAITVVCPVVRDFTTTKWKELEMTVRDGSAQSNVICSAYSAQRDGLQPGSPTTQSSTGSDTIQTLKFLPPEAERDYGSFYIKCTLPAVGSKTSEILEYRIREGS